MERDELRDWLRLQLTPGIGNETARRLLAAFGLPQAVFAQAPAALRQLVGTSQATALQIVPDGLDELLERTWRWLHGADGDGAARRIVTLGDAGYPAPLLTTADPPLLLHLLGRIGAPGRELNWHPDGSSTSFNASENGATSAVHGLAMVGSRSPSPQGASTARQFARAFVEAGLTVVSGMALGIDAASHEGALDAAATAAQPLATLAVIGTGIDRVYPRQHHELAHRIARHGLMVSEYLLGTPPLPANFPKRNRLIAGLSQGTLVVEAALRSGSLITARLAVEQGKDVFAIPGSIHGPHARGCHALIKQGAKLVESAQDVLEELRIITSVPGAASSASAEPSGQSDAAADAVLVALGADPVGLDALLARTGWDTPQLQARLLELELDGRVGRLPGGLFQRLGLS